MRAEATRKSINFSISFGNFSNFCFRGFLSKERKKDFYQRLEKINWDNQINDYPFNQSALALYKWAPIADELKNLDRQIVLNSVILKWDIIKKELSERTQI